MLARAAPKRQPTAAIAKARGSLPPVFRPILCALRGSSLAVALGLLSCPSFAQPVPVADHAVSQPTASEQAALPRYHHSIISWEHTVTSQTLGIGETPQSYDPTYTMGLTARLRYYLLDDTPKGEHFSLRLDSGLYREFTNSDVTTRRGEWDFSDTDLGSVYARRVQGETDTHGTFFELRPLTLTLPTSKISYESGRYFAPGVLVGVTHVTPLLRPYTEHVSSTIRFAVGYKRWFARATVPTNESLNRERLTLDGPSLPSDTLSGSSLIRDQLDFSAMLRLELGENLLWSTNAAIAPAWKYDLPKDVHLCALLTGCTDIGVSPDDSRYLVRTQFSTEFSWRLTQAFSVELGYGNTSNQLGPDGRRRSFFYSPESVFYASLSFFPHELVAGSTRLARNALTPSQL